MSAGYPIILGRNIFDTATITESPAFVATLAATYMQDQTHTAARTTGLQSGSPLQGQLIKLSWPTDQRANCLTLPRNNLTAASAISLWTYTDTAFSAGQIAQGAQNGFGYTGLDRIDVITEADFLMLKNSAYYFPLVTNMRSAIILIEDAANTDGYIELARGMMGETWQLGASGQYGDHIIYPADMTVQGRNDGGGLDSDKREKYMVQELQHKLFSETTDWEKLLAHARYIGLDHDFWFSLYPGDGTWMECYHQGQYKFTSIPKANRWFPGLVSGPLVMEGR